MVLGFTGSLTIQNPIKLGEQVAIGILQEQTITYNEDSYFTLAKFDGTKIKISRAGIETI